jgi:hypothetical protein
MELNTRLIAFLVSTFIRIELKVLSFVPISDT